MQNLVFVLQQMHTALIALTSYEANNIVANSRKNPLEAWRRLQKRCDPTTGGRKRSLLRTIISPGRCSLLELQAGTERWESHVSRYEKKMKDKLDVEIKLAGLESLVPEELEKHLILNSNRLRTFEDARLEVVTYVEAKFGLGTRDSKPSDTGARGHSDPMDDDAVNSSTKGTGSSSPRDGCFECGGAHFQRDCNARKSTSKQSYGKGKQSKSWSKSVCEPSFSGKGKSQEKQGKIQRNIQRTKCANQGAKGFHKGKTSKAGLSGLENPKSEVSSDTQESAQTCTTDTSWHDGWNGDEWNDGWSFDEWKEDWSSVGWHEGWEQTYDTSASSFSLGGLDVSATSSPKLFEWVKMNLYTGLAVNTFPLNFWSRRSRRWKTLSDCQW